MITSSATVTHTWPFGIFPKKIALVTNVDLILVTTMSKLALLLSCCEALATEGLEGEGLCRGCGSRWQVHEASTTWAALTTGTLEAWLDERGGQDPLLTALQAADLHGALLAWRRAQNQNSTLEGTSP